MARRGTVTDQEYLDSVTGETELARQDEQLERRTEPQPRRKQPYYPGGRESKVHAGRGQAEADPVAVWGLDDHAIPAGIDHPGYEEVSPERLHAKVPQPYYSGDMAHGVANHDHANFGAVKPHPIERHGHGAEPVIIQPEEVEPNPVPVYIVERAGGGKGRLTTALDNRTVPVSGSDPVRLVGQDLHRVRVGLLNEDSSHDARVSVSLAELAQGRGALLPHGATSYLWFHTQDVLFGVGAGSNTAALSIIVEYEQPGGGG